MPTSIASRELTEVNVTEVIVDPDYQRGLIAQHVAKMAAQWDPHFASSLILSKRNGKLYAIDGQQRSAALTKRCADIGAQSPMLPAIVWTNLSQQEEAKMYVNYNAARRNVTGWEKHKARIIAKDPDAIFVRDTCAANGLTVSTANASDAIGCVAALYRMLTPTRSFGAVDRAAAFAWAIEVYRASWGALPGEPWWRADVVEGLAAVHLAGGRPAQAKLVKKLQALRVVESTDTAPSLIDLAKTEQPGNNRPVGGVVKVITKLAA